MTIEFDPKDPAEIVPLAMDFANLTAAPLSPVVTITRHSGPKGSPDLSGMLAGSPQIDGTEVRQLIQGGVAGTVYRVTFQVDSGDGSRFREAGLLPVETA
jgi:hypothetical protein